MGGGPPPRSYEGPRVPDGDEYRSEDKFHRGPPLPPSRGGQFPPDRPLGEPGRTMAFQQQQDLQRPLQSELRGSSGSGAIDVRQQDPRHQGVDSRQQALDSRQDSRQGGLDPRHQGPDPRQQAGDGRQGMDPRQANIDLRQLDPRQPVPPSMDLRQGVDTRQQSGDNRQPIDLRQQPIDSRENSRQQSMDPRQQAMDPRQLAMDPRQQAIDNRQQSMDPRQPGMDPRQQAMDPRQQAMDPRQPPRGPPSQREYSLERKGPPMHPEGGSGFGRVSIHLDDGILPPRLSMRGAEEGMGGRPPMHPEGALSRVPMHPEEPLPPHHGPEPYPPRSFSRQEQGSDDVFFRPGPPQPPGRFQGGGGGPQDYPMDGYSDNERPTGAPRYPPEGQGPPGGQRYPPPESQGPLGGPRYPPPENQGPLGGQRYPPSGFQPGRGLGRGQGPPRGPPAPYGGLPNELAPSQDPRVGRGGVQQQYPGRLEDEYQYQGDYGEEEDPEFQHDRASSGGNAPGRRPLLQTPVPGSRDEGGGGERRDSRSRDRERGGREGERGSVERDRGHHSPSPRDRRRASSDRDNPPKRPRKSDERDDKPKTGSGGRERKRK